MGRYMWENNVNQYLDIATGSATEAGRLIKRLSKNRHSISFKGKVDLVTEADVQSEELIKRTIKASFPEHAFLGEEGGLTGDGSDFIWIVDPIDGTTNYAHDFPIYAISIALEYRGEVILGSVFDPNQDELFTAIKGEGAFLNSKPISVSSTATLNESLLATGFPYFYRDNPDFVLKCFEAFSYRAQGLRRAGAAVIDLVSLACGRFDGFWELGLQPWDTAAGALIATEAGAIVTKLNGDAFDIRVPEILAANPAIHRDMLDVVASLTQS